MDATPQGHRLVAFGLGVDCEFELTGSTNTSAGVPLPRPRTTIRLTAQEAMDAEWNRSAERIFEPEYPDGRSRFTIDRSSGHYRLWFEGFGRYLVSTDGALVACERDAVSAARRERFLFAQVLPLAAALNGLEPLHAGAVCLGERVVGFAGQSGAGKTSLSSRLVLRGAALVADDVLALEHRPDAPLAHPGPSFVVVRNRDDPLLGDSAAPLGRTVGTSDKIHLAVPATRQPMPLSALYYLEPGPKIRITPLERATVRRILESCFAPYLVTPDRLRRHLEMADLLNRSVGQFRLQIPRDGDFEAAAEVVEAHVHEAAHRC